MDFRLLVGEQKDSEQLYPHLLVLGFEIWYTEKAKYNARRSTPKGRWHKKEVAIPMCVKEHLITVKTVNGRFFDLFDGYKYIVISDYSLLNHELIVDANMKIELGGEHKRYIVSSISEMKQHFEEIISAVIQELTEMFSVDVLGAIDCKYPNIIAAAEDMIQFATTNIPVGFNYSTFRTHFDFTITEDDKKLLVEQLVFDILFDKYLKESKRMTRNEYSRYVAEKFCPDGCNKLVYARAANERLTRAMGTYSDRMVYTNLRKQLRLLGIDSDKYAKYYTPRMKVNPTSKKPQFIWDQLWYNFYLPLTSRQYRRQFTRQGRNYPYEEIFNDLKEYNRFVTELLPVEKKECDKYYLMSMDYYGLESYKRIDFMLKLISSLPQTIINEIDKDHFLVKRFHPIVLVPYARNGELCLTEKCKYYRPLFMVENKLQEKMLRDAAIKGIFDYSTYTTQLLKFQIIRAKAYELFKYHGVFHSNDYVEMKAFLCKSYDMRFYHLSNDAWNLIQDTEWKNMNEEGRQRLKALIRNLISISDALFWKSPNREFTKPPNE